MIDIKIAKYFDKLTIRDILVSFHIAKSKIHNLNGYVYINQNKALMDDIVKTDDVLSIDMRHLNLKEVELVEGPIDKVYEDQDLLIINKPKGILVHTDGNEIDTLTNRVAYHYQDYPYPVLPVHRLDVETSGILVFAKHPLSHAYLSYLFEIRQIEKTYEALVEGILKDENKVIKAPIGKDRHQNKQMVTQHGQSAHTTYKVIKRYDDETLCHINIMGGRKHQIRVHMASIGHPVVGDLLYGHIRKTDAPLRLSFIHIKFKHPTSREPFSFHIKK